MLRGTAGFLCEQIWVKTKVKRLLNELVSGKRNWWNVPSYPFYFQWNVQVGQIVVTLKLKHAIGLSLDINKGSVDVPFWLYLAGSFLLHGVLKVFVKYLMRFANWRKLNAILNVHIFYYDYFRREDVVAVVDDDVKSLCAGRASPGARGGRQSLPSQALPPRGLCGDQQSGYWIQVLLSRFSLCSQIV